MSDRRQLTAALPVISWGGIGALALAACVSTDLFTDGDGVISASGGNGGAGGGAEVGGAPSTGGSPATGGDGGTGAVGGAGGEAPCLEEIIEPEPVELRMLIVVDRSGSMQGTYWVPTVNALKAFFDDPLSAGVGVALNLFPHPTFTTPVSCDPANFNPPLSPGGDTFAILPTDAATLKTALDTNPPAGTTPMYGALEGSLEFARVQAQANPSARYVVVVAGDGEPCCGECEQHYGDALVESVNGVTDLVGSYFTTYGLETYTISIAPNVVAAMNQIAVAGGTMQTYDVSTNISAFAQKMQEIRGAAIGCEYLIPDAMQGTFDPLDASVIYTPGSGGPDQVIPRVSTEGDCGGAPGWFYDDNVMPTKVTLCAASCAVIENDLDPKVNLSFGCLED